MAILKVQDGAPLVDGRDYRVSWYTWCQNQWGINSIVERVTAHTGGPTMGDLAEALQSLTETNQTLWLPSQVTILGVRVTELTGPLPHSIAGVATSGALGTLAGPPVPTQSTGIISAKSALAGRGYRGRIFTPFVDPAFVGTDGLPTNAYKGLVGSFATFTYLPQALVPVAGGTIATEARIFQRSTLTSVEVLSYLVRSYWGTQKKRGDLGRTNPKSIPL